MERKKSFLERAYYKMEAIFFYILLQRYICSLSRFISFGFGSLHILFFWFNFWNIVSFPIIKLRHLFDFIHSRYGSLARSILSASILIMGS